MATPQFSDLTTVPTQTQVWQNELLPALQSPPSGVPVNVTSWSLGSVYRAMAMAVALLRVNVRIAIATLTYAGFEDYVFGRVTPPTPPGGTALDVTGWAPLVAKQRYGITQQAATYTLRQMTITNTSASAYANLKPGALMVQLPSGNRYSIQGAASSLSAAAGVGDVTLSVYSTVGFPSSGTVLVDTEQMTYTGITSNSLTGVVRGANGTTAATHLASAVVSQVLTIPAAVGLTPGTLTTVFRSELAYQTGSTYNNDPSNAAISLVTAGFPGCTVTNPSTSFSSVAQAGPGVGTVSPGGTPSGSHTISVQIVTSGTIAGSTAGWQYAVDGGAWSATQTAAGPVTVTGSITVTLADNGGSPSFIAGTAYSFTTPGSDLLQTGQVAQTAQSLGAAAAGMWPSLSFPKDSNGNAIPVSPTASAYVLLALAASSNVAMAYATTDATINNLVRVLIAGQGGAPSLATTIAAVQQFFNAYGMLTDKVVVATTTQRTITLSMTGGTIQVKASQLANAQATLQQRLQTYFGGSDAAAALGVNGVVDYDYILALIRTLPGVVPGGVTGTLQVNGGTANIQLPVTPGAFEVASWSQQVAAALPWSAV